MSGIRRDLRSYHQSRPISMNIGGVHEVDGACKYLQGKTSVLATVVGPVVPKFQRHELTDKGKVEIEVNYASNIENLNENRSGSDELAITSYLKRTIIPCIQLDVYPRKLIVIQILILQNEGSVVSAAVNATILALINAGIPMLYFMTCVELAVSNAAILLDPTSEEETAATGIISLCIKGQQPQSENNEIENQEEVLEDKIISFDILGAVSSATITPATEIACKYSQALANSMRQSIAANLSNIVLY